MRNLTISAAVSMVLFGGSIDDAQAGKTCIESATAALPKISGIVVKRSRTRPATPEVMASWKGQLKPVMIDLEVVTEGEAQVYSYLCVMSQGSALVQRTMY
jgi:hypothetical protein